MMREGAERQNVLAIRGNASERLAIFQERYPQQVVDVARRQWLYRITPGSRSGQVPLAMLPGIQGGGDAFFELVLALGREIPLISVTAPDIESVAEMVAGTSAFFDRAGLGRVHILGSSLGGYLAQALCLAEPERVEQLIIANGFYDPGPFLAKGPPAATLAAADAKELVVRNLAQLRDESGADPGEIALATAMRALVGPVQSFDNYKSRVLLLANAKALERPPIADERVMLIDNDRDPLILPEMRDALRRRYARAELHAIDDGGHLPAIQRPQQFADLVRGRLTLQHIAT